MFQIDKIKRMNILVNVLNPNDIRVLNMLFVFF